MRKNTREKVPKAQPDLSAIGNALANARARVNVGYQIVVSGS